jgi:hypothetical protein
MNTSALDEFFSQTSVPVGPEYNRGFLEIIGKQTHENTWSKLYAHFLKDLYYREKFPFLEALIRVIKNKNGMYMRFQSHQVYTEVATKKGRIDIVIKDKNTHNTILIENKVYHLLINDLADYWDFFEVPQVNKVGIILALSELPIAASLKSKYISIKHLDWIKEIKNILKEDQYNLEENIYLKDFISTIEQVSMNKNLNEQSAFYFEHAEAVNKAVECRTAAEQYLLGQYESIAAKLGLQQFGDKLEWRNFWDQKNDLDIYFTVDVTDLLEGKKKVDLIIEMTGKPLEQLLEFRQLLADDAQYQKMDKDREVNQFLHFGYKTYSLETTDLADLDNYILSKIKADFGGAFVKMVKYYYPNTDIGSWSDNLLE